MSLVEAVESLYELMNRDLPFEEKAEQALGLGAEVLGVDNGHLARIHPESEYWKSIASTDPPDGAYPAGVRLGLETTYCRRVIESDGSVALHDAPDQGWADDPAYEEHGLHCYHGSSFKLDEETYGTVCFVSERPREEPFTDEETLFAEFVARLLEHEARRERTDAKVERLEEFADVLSHDIRNPLTVALSRTETAQLEQESEHLDEVVDALRRIDDIVSEVLTVTRQGQRVEATEEVRLADVADQCWAMVAVDQSSLTVDGDLAFQAAAGRLRRLFENIYRNSIEHGGDEVSVRFGPLPDGDGFYIEDDGPGVPIDERDAVFEVEYTVGDDGLGFGLAIVERVATAHGWDVEVTESATGGARFEFSDVVVSTAR